MQTTNARPGLVWVNTSALERAIALAKEAGADPADLTGAERALASRSAPSWRFTMLIQKGFLEVKRAIRQHARFRAYTNDVFDQIIATADQDGLLLTEADQLAEACDVPRSAIYSVLLDLEREPIAAITRITKGRQLRGVQITGKVHHKPRPRPDVDRRRTRQERAQAAA